MSNLKRMVSFIVVLAMLATTCVFTLNVFAADETNPMVSDVTLNDEDLVIAEKLTTFGIVDAVGEEQLVNYLTRADVISVLVQYLGLQGTTLTADTTPFLDVSVFDGQIGAYSMLYKAGYIAGDENKMYRPNDLLTYNEAVTLVVNVMGYKVFAIRNGGYPEGYLYTANRYGLLKGLRGNGQNPIPYCDLYRLIEASLDADAVVERVFSSNGEGEFKLQKDLTVLEEIYNIKTIKGIVTGTEDTRLLSSGSELIGIDQIEIENVIYDAPDRIYAEYLGRNVIAYAVENDQKEYEIIYIELAENKNSEIQIEAEELLPQQTTSSKIYYEDEEDDYKEKHVDVNATNLSVIYNGKAHSGYGALKNALPESGYIIGLDNSGDDVIDVLFVYEFQNLVVGAIDTTTGTFYDKYLANTATGDGTYVFDTDKDDIRVYNAGGRTTTLDNIRPDTLLSVTETSNANGYKLIHIYTCDETVAGTIDEIYNDEYSIGGEYYELAPNAEDYIEAGELPELQIGMTITAYLDIEGKIGNFSLGAAEGGTDTARYGFVAGVDIPDDGIDSKLTLKIFTQDSEWLEVETVDKINIDGNRYSIGTAAGMRQASDNIPVGEIIRFRMQDNKVGYIDTSAPNVDTTSDVGNLHLLAYGQTGTYNESTGTWSSTGDGFQQRYGIASAMNDTSSNKFILKSGKYIVFSTPNSRELLGDKMDEYSVTTSLSRNYYKFSGSYTQPVTDSYYVYNLGEEDINAATCVLLRGSASGSKSLGRDTVSGIVTKFGSAIDEDGVSRKKLYYSTGGAESGLLVADEVAYAYTKPSDGLSPNNYVSLDSIGLKPGDIVQLGTNADGHIATINVLYRCDQTAENADEAWLNASNKHQMGFGDENGGGGIGTVAKVDNVNGILQYAITTGTGDAQTVSTYNVNAGGASVAIYRTATEKVESGSLASLLEGDVIYFRSTTGYSSTINQIIVYR